LRSSVIKQVKLILFGYENAVLLLSQTEIDLSDKNLFPL
jgi:hypothetical protein